MAKDVQGEALWDYYNGKSQGKLMIHNEYGEPEEMPVEVFFRGYEDLTELEVFGVGACKGDILDIGAGAGAMSLGLQYQGKQVVALEPSPKTAKILKLRGVQEVVCSEALDFKGGRFDTLLLMMNGMGIVGKVNKLVAYLDCFKQLLAPGGQVLFDSSNISYLYEGLEMPPGYYGELKYQYEYKGQKGEWFDWLYIDQTTMGLAAMENGWGMEVLYEDENGQYLARLHLD